MACTSPFPAWRVPSGEVFLREPFPRPEGTYRLLVPCGGCTGCRLALARSWAIRCQLELHHHPGACWVTLTYDEDSVPHTLHKGHLQKWLKRVRFHFRKRRVRFFACGEYGEQNGRPHYHVILFGIAHREAWPCVELWKMGRAQVDHLEPAAIAYVCGYQLKKASGVRERVELGPRVPFHYEGPATSKTFVDRATGEEYRYRIDYEPPFLQMSRRPGIGGDSRKFWKSWRDSAIWSGKPVPVPRYLHEAWKGKASPEELLALEAEKLALQPSSLDELAERRRHLLATASINESRKRLQLERRKL